MRYDKAIAQGRWPGILAGLGVDEQTLSGRNVPCPFCGGKDRFRFTDHNGDGLWVCNVCGSGNGVQFVQQWKDVDFKAAVEMVQAAVGSAPIAPPKKSAWGSNKLNTLWKSASGLDASDPVGEYLLARGVWCEPSDELRFIANMKYFDGGVVARHYDAMLARVRDGNGRPTTMHVTYLNGARKADVKSPKKVLSTMGAGAAIRLYPAGKLLAVAEGIETALAVRLQTDYPVWSTISAGGMKGLIVPADVREVLIYADNDASFTGQAAAYALAQRMVAEGRRAYVYVPPHVGTDFADPGSWE